MKKIKTLIFLLSVVVISFDSYGQRKEAIQDVPISVTAFDQGNLKFNLSRPLDFYIGSNKSDGEKTSGFADINIRGQGTYFVADGIGVGGNINLERDKTNYEDSDNSTIDSEILVGVHGVYGQQIGNINGYVQPFLAVGRNKTEYKYDNNSTEYKDGIFRMGIKAGVMLPIGGENSNTYFTPHAGWRFTKYTDKDNSSNSSTTSRLFFGGGLTVVIPTVDIPCDCNTDFENVGDRLTEGNNILELNNKIKFSNYNYKEEYEDGFGETVEDEDSQVDFRFGIAYKRAVIDNLFVGLDFYLNTDKYDYKEDQTQTYSSTSFYVGPTAEFYPLTQPKLSNTFVGTSLTFGGLTSKSDNAGNTSESKYSRINFDLHVGYDYGITDKISIVPQFGYEVFKSTNKDDKDDTYSYGGIYLGAETRFRFDF